jgi:hypothetical protein
MDGQTRGEALDRLGYEVAAVNVGVQHHRLDQGRFILDVPNVLGYTWRIGGRVFNLVKLFIRQGK